MPKVTWTGDASSAERAQEKLTAAVKKYNEEVQKGTKSAAQLEAQAKKLAEQHIPQEKYNAQMRQLGELVTKNKLTFEQATQIAQKYGRELDTAGKSGERAFGSQFVGNLAASISRVASLAAAVGAVTAALRENEQRAQAAADEGLRARAGIGSLTQLAATEGNSKAEREAAFQRLVSEARGFQSIGAVDNENDAGSLLFELASAGLGKDDRSFAAKLRAGGTLQNVGGAAQAFDALKTALGGGEVGDFRQFMSKALQAAAVAPGSFENLPIAAAQAGGSAKNLGVSDEFLLAATALIGKQSGSVDEGGTQVAAFLRQVEKSGLKVEGLGGVGIVEAIAKLPEKQQGFGGVLGDRAEAVSGFRTLSANLPQLKALEAQIANAQGGDLAGAAVALSASDPRQRAANRRALAEGSAAQTEAELSAERENLFEVLRARRRASSGGGIAGAIGSFVEQRFLGLQDVLGSENEALEEAVSLNQRGLSPADIADMKDYLRRSAHANESTQSIQRSKIATRAE